MKSRSVADCDAELVSMAAATVLKSIHPEILKDLVDSLPEGHWASLNIVDRLALVKEHVAGSPELVEKQQAHTIALEQQEQCQDQESPAHPWGDAVPEMENLQQSLDERLLEDRLHSHPKVRSVNVYRNGFTIDNGRFHPMTSKRTKQFLKELKDKVVPYELQQKKMQSCPLVVRDKHTEEYQVTPTELTPMQKKLQQRREALAQRKAQTGQATTSPQEVADLDDSWIDEVDQNEKMGSSKKTNASSEKQNKRPRRKKASKNNTLVTDAVQENGTTNGDEADTEDFSGQADAVAEESVLAATEACPEAEAMAEARQVDTVEALKSAHDIADCDEEDAPTGIAESGIETDGTEETEMTEATEPTPESRDMVENQLEMHSASVFSREVLLTQRAAIGVSHSDRGQLPFLQPRYPCDFNLPLRPITPPPGLEGLADAAPMARESSVSCHEETSSADDNICDVSQVEAANCETLHKPSENLKEEVLLARDMAVAVANFLYGDDDCASQSSEDESCIRRGASSCSIATTATSQTMVTKEIDEAIPKDMFYLPLIPKTPLG